MTMKTKDQTIALWKSIAVKMAAKVDDYCGCDYCAYLTEKEQKLLAAERRKAAR